MSIANVIKKRRLELGMSQDDLASKMGMNKSTISRYESSEIEGMSIQVIPKLAKALNCEPEDLMGWASTTKFKTIIFDDFFPLYYRKGLSAGGFEEVGQDIEPDAVVYVPIKFQVRRKRLVAFEISGDSMNKLFPDRSVLVIERTDPINLKSGDIIVALKDGGATVKRYITSETGVVLFPESTNPRHQPIIINKEDDFIEIIGRVIWHSLPDDIADTY